MTIWFSAGSKQPNCERHARPLQPRRGRGSAPSKVGVVQPVEQRREIVMRSGRLVRDAARPPLALQQDALPRGTRVGELAVDFDQVFRSPPPVQPAEQNRGDRFHDRARRRAQNVRNPDARNIFAQPDRVREVRVGMVFDDELRRAAFAAEPRIDAMKNLRAAGYEPSAGLVAAARSPHCFLRTGAGSAVFSASSASRDRVLRAVDGVFERVAIVVEMRRALVVFLKGFEKLLFLRVHQFQGIADVHLLILRDLDLVGAVVDASGISIEQAVENLAFASFGHGALKLVIEFLQPIFGERDVQLDALVGGQRVADFVRLFVAEVILRRVVLRARTSGRRARSRERRQHQADGERSRVPL